MKLRIIVMAVIPSGTMRPNHIWGMALDHEAGRTQSPLASLIGVVTATAFSPATVGCTILDCGVDLTVATAVLQ